MVAVLCRMDHPCDPMYTWVPPPDITQGTGSILSAPWLYVSRLLILLCWKQSTM